MSEIMRYCDSCGQAFVTPTDQVTVVYDAGRTSDNIFYRYRHGDMDCGFINLRPLSPDFEKYLNSQDADLYYFNSVKARFNEGLPNCPSPLTENEVNATVAQLKKNTTAKIIEMAMKNY